MSYLVAISGKGGVGKTTVAALIINKLIAQGKSPVLAVDADPNSCLDSALGVTVHQTVGGVREEAREIAGKGIMSGISKHELLELKVSESLVESEKFDLIAMGRPEGPGCYCYANNVLKETLSKLSSNYPYVVLDNEAGLENLSRRIVKKVDLFIMVADPSLNGLKTVRRLHDLAREMNIEYGRLVVIVNRVRNDKLLVKISELAGEIGANDTVCLPDDENLSALAEDGKSITTLPEGNVVLKRIDELLLRNLL